MNLSLLLAERSIDHFVPPTPDSSPPARTHRSRSRSPKGSELAPKSRPMTPNPPRFFSSAANRSSKSQLTANSRPPKPMHLPQAGARSSRAVGLPTRGKTMQPPPPATPVPLLPRRPHDGLRPKAPASKTHATRAPTPYANYRFSSCHKRSSCSTWPTSGLASSHSCPAHRVLAFPTAARAGRPSTSPPGTHPHQPLPEQAAPMTLAPSALFPPGFYILGLPQQPS